MICTDAKYYAFGFTKEGEMEKGIWEVWRKERQKQDFGGDTGWKEATWNIQA